MEIERDDLERIVQRTLIRCYEQAQILKAAGAWVPSWVFWDLGANPEAKKLFVDVMHQTLTARPDMYGRPLPYEQRTEVELLRARLDGVAD